MKNLYIIPTNKFSKLAYYQESTSHKDAELQLVTQPSSDYKYQNIYIISNEDLMVDNHSLQLETGVIFKIKEILEPDHLYLDYKGNKHWDNFDPWCVKKIILTTDPDLIADGIQPIDNEFLEWYVQNPSCEDVEIDKVRMISYNFPASVYNKYKIITPKESFTHEIKELSKEEVLNERSNTYEFADFEEKVCNCGLKESEHNVRHPFISRQEQEICNYCGKTIREQMKGWCSEITCYRQFLPKAEPKSLIEKMKPFQEQWQKDMDKHLNPKQETLEEATDKSLQDEINYWYEKTGSLTSKDIVKRAYSLGIKTGAEWQARRSYNEVLEWLANNDYLSDKVEIIKEEFNQNKKK